MVRHNRSKLTNKFKSNCLIIMFIIQICVVYQVSNKNVTIVENMTDITCQECQTIVDL